MFKVNLYLSLWLTPNFTKDVNPLCSIKTYEKASPAAMSLIINPFLLGIVNEIRCNVLTQDVWVEIGRPSWPSSFEPKPKRVLFWKRIRQWFLPVTIFWIWLFIWEREIVPWTWSGRYPKEWSSFSSRIGFVCGILGRRRVWLSMSYIDWK